MTNCFLYLAGYDHQVFGTAMVLRVAADVHDDLEALRETLPEDVQEFCRFRFRSAMLAEQVREAFYASELIAPIRGGWVGGEPLEAMFYLQFIVVHLLSASYGRDEIADVRRESGLVHLFETTDRATGEQQERWNEKWHDWEVLWTVQRLPTQH